MRYRPIRDANHATARDTATSAPSSSQASPPRASTTELARRHGLAPSTVSAHLTALRETGLLASRRQGY